jgi:hypothetical protein
MSMSELTYKVSFESSCRNLADNDIILCMSGFDRLCGLVVSIEDYKHRGPGFDYRALLRIFLRELGLERGPLSLVIG